MALLISAPSSSTSLCFCGDNNAKDPEDPPINHVVQTAEARFEERTGLRGLFPAVVGSLSQRVDQESKEMDLLDEKASAVDDGVA